MFRLRCPSIPRSTAGDVHEGLPLQPVKATGKAEPQSAFAILINGIASEAEVRTLGLGLGERGEGAAIKAVHAMPRGANPDVAILVLQDGIDLALSQKITKGTKNQRVKPPTKKPTCLIPNATN